MSGSDLHRFDVELCREIAGNVASLLDDPRGAGYLAAGLDPRILAYVQAQVAEAAAPELLLGYQELIDLMRHVEAAPDECYRQWVPWPARYDRYMDCLPEIRRELADECAQRWARISTTFSSELQTDRLSLAEGIELVREWIMELRRLLRAMGAVHFLPPPDGAFPSALNPTPSPIRPKESPDPQTIAALRRILASSPDRRTAKAASLIQEARLNRQRGYQALRWLEKKGEYAGFDRGQVRRRHSDGHESR